MEFSRETEHLLNGITHAGVRQAFSSVDRSRFVSDNLQDEAWADRPLPIEDEATISQPSLVAKMTEWLDPDHGQQILEIGTGSGYQSAILVALGAEVFTVEFSRLLSRAAEERLQALGVNQVHFHRGDGAEGWAAHAPYDRILSTVAFPERPVQLLDQLSPAAGIALIPVGPPGQTQYLTRYVKNDDTVAEERLLPVRFLSLR